MAKTKRPATFAGRLRSLRTAAGLSVADLAERANLNKSAVYHLERGLREPAFATACALADALGVPVDRLRNG